MFLKELGHPFLTTHLRHPAVHKDMRVTCLWKVLDTNFLCHTVWTYFFYHTFAAPSASHRCVPDISSKSLGLPFFTAHLRHPVVHTDVRLTCLRKILDTHFLPPSLGTGALRKAFVRTHGSQPVAHNAGVNDTEIQFWRRSVATQWLTDLCLKISPTADLQERHAFCCSFHVFYIPAASCGSCFSSTLGLGGCTWTSLPSSPSSTSTWRSSTVLWLVPGSVVVWWCFCGLVLVLGLVC